MQGGTDPGGQVLLRLGGAAAGRPGQGPLPPAGARAGPPAERRFPLPGRPFFIPRSRNRPRAPLLALLGGRGRVRGEPSGPAAARPGRGEFGARAGGPSERRPAGPRVTGKVGAGAFPLSPASLPGVSRRLSGKGVAPSASGRLPLAVGGFGTTGPPVLPQERSAPSPAQLRGGRAERARLRKASPLLPRPTRDGAPRGAAPSRRERCPAPAARPLRALPRSRARAPVPALRALSPGRRCARAPARCSVGMAVALGLAERGGQSRFNVRHVGRGVLSGAGAAEERSQRPAQPRQRAPPGPVSECAPPCRGSLGPSMRALGGIRLSARSALAVAPPSPAGAAIAA